MRRCVHNATFDCPREAFKNSDMLVDVERLRVDFELAVATRCKCRATTPALQGCSAKHGRWRAASPSHKGAEAFVHVGDLTWDGMRARAARDGMRLPTAEEVRGILGRQPYPAVFDKDTWIPVQGAGAGAGAGGAAGQGVAVAKDWVQIGDYRAGQSHTLQHGGYPEWGDISFHQPFRGYVMMLHAKDPPQHTPARPS